MVCGNIFQEGINVKEMAMLAECVAFYRHQMKESQEVFAEGCGLSAEMISLIERRKTNPSIETVVRISRHIGIPIWEMFQFAEK